MATQADIDALTNRIAKAESDRDTWRAAGSNEKYLGAYFLVETLNLQLDKLLRRHFAQEVPDEFDSRARS